MTATTYAYDTLPGWRTLDVDVYSPAGPGLHPGVIIIHGGAWRMGDRSQFGPAVAGWDPSFFEKVAAAGFVVASIDYRLSGEAIWPAQLDDVRAAAAWLADHAEELRLDPNRVGVWGESAGGHLACLLALAGPGESSRPEQPRARVDVRAAIGWYPPTNLASMSAQKRADAIGDADRPGSPEEQLLGRPVHADPALTASASPVSHVSAGAPPFLLMHGEQDRLVPLGQSQELAAALQAHGVSVELVIVPGADHVWAGYDDVDGLVARSVGFLQRQLDDVRR